MYGIGAQLREERLRRKLALDDIARETRIPSRYLQAIEAEDYEKLPGLVFTRNFVRQYAKALGLNAEPLVERLPKLEEAELKLPDPPARERKRHWHMRSNPAIASAAWMAVLVIAGVAAYYHFNGFPWVRERLPEMWRTTQVAAAAAHQATEVKPAEVRQTDAHQAERTAAAVTARAAANPADTAPTATAQNQTVPAASGGANAAVQAPQNPAMVAAPVAAAVATPDPAAASRPVQVVVTAHAASWLQVTADGKPAYTGTLQPNETKRISAEGAVRVLTGNAGGVTISLNGRTLDPLGPDGQVRSVRLTVNGPEFPAAKTETPAADPL